MPADGWQHPAEREAQIVLQALASVRACPFIPPLSERTFPPPHLGVICVFASTSAAVTLRC